MFSTMMTLFFNFMTMPGVPVHEFAHAWACRRVGVAVHEVCYLRIGNPRGYVIHDQTQNSTHHIFIATAPFFVCTLVACLITIAFMLFQDQHFLSKQHEEIVGPIVIWLAWAIGCCAFPSGGDADSLWEDFRRSRFGIGKLLILPVVGLIRVAQVGSFFWLDFTWGMFSAITLPIMVVKLFTS